MNHQDEKDSTGKKDKKDNNFPSLLILLSPSVLGVLTVLSVLI